MTHAWKMVAALALLAPRVVDAQLCMGLPAFSAGRVQIGAAADFGNDAQAFIGTLSVGSPAGPFAGVLIGTVSYDDVDGNSTAIGGQLGWQLPIGTASRVQLCPVAGVVRSFADDLGGAEVASWDVVFGLQLGVPTGASSQFRIVPTAGAALAYTKARFEAGIINFEEDETFGILSLGLGLLLNARVSLLPTVEIPVGLDDADPVLGIMLAVNFGGRS